jgi:protein TonB
MKTKRETNGPADRRRGFDTGEAGPRSGWRSVVAAVLCTLGLFVLLPFSEIVSEAPSTPVEILPVSTTRPPLPPPTVLERTVPRPEPVPTRPERSEIREKPRLESVAPQARAPLRLPVALRAPTPEFTPDFELGFTVEPGSAVEAAPASPPDLDLVFGLDEVDRPPRPIVRSRPVYPYGAQRREVEGFVEIEFVVTRDGRVDDLRVVRSEPGDLFVEAVRRAVARWRFEPAELDGEPVAVRVGQTLRFEMN